MDRMKFPKLAGKVAVPRDMIYGFVSNKYKCVSRSKSCFLLVKQSLCLRLYMPFVTFVGVLPHLLFTLFDMIVGSFLSYFMQKISWLNYFYSDPKIQYAFSKVPASIAIIIIIIV